MKLILLTILLLLTWQTPLPGQEVDQRANELLRKGEDAMGDRLWELARHHYEALLKLDNLDEQTREEASIRLAEALIRDGEPGAALELLTQTHLRDHPENSFWEGQALAANGRFSQAVETLKARLESDENAKLPGQRA